jgi:hypothetical protein
MLSRLAAAAALSVTFATLAAPDAKPAAPAVIARGEKLKGLAPVKLEELLAAPEKYEGKDIQLTATVRRACMKKGCWMELAPEASGKGEGVRVTFKDYGFFVPTDSAGATCTVEGKVAVKTLSEDDAKHYEGEGATIRRDKDGKAREVSLVAVAVELKR